MKLEMFFLNKFSLKLLGILIAFPIAIAANYVAGVLIEEKALLIVAFTSTTVAGSTVSDLQIQNAGSIELTAVNGKISFTDKVAWSISPVEFRNCSKFENNLFTLDCKNEIWLPAQAVNVRFTSTGRHSVEDRNGIAPSFVGLPISRQIHGRPINSGPLEPFYEPITWVALLVILVLALVGAPTHMPLLSLNYFNLFWEINKK